MLLFNDFYYYRSGDINTGELRVLVQARTRRRIFVLQWTTPQFRDQPLLLSSAAPPLNTYASSEQRLQHTVSTAISSACNAWRHRKVLLFSFDSCTNSKSFMTILHSFSFFSL